MGWMNEKDPEPKTDGEQEAVLPFQANISLGQYCKLPWTVQWIEGKASWTCLELGISDTSITGFDRLALLTCKKELAKAAQGTAPKLPTGMVWRDGIPVRDPGKVRILDTKRY
jgi:hypothetical protein